MMGEGGGASTRNRDGDGRHGTFPPPTRILPHRGAGHGTHLTQGGAKIGSRIPCNAIVNTYLVFK